MGLVDYTKPLELAGTRSGLPWLLWCTTDVSLSGPRHAFPQGPETLASDGSQQNPFAELPETEGSVLPWEAHIQ